MSKYVIDEDVLKRLADAIREVSGTNKSYTPNEMIDAVSTILENGTYILEDENGVEFPAVFVDNEKVFTATANDIRIGTTAVTEAGVTEGTKEIPAYHTTEGVVTVPIGSRIKITSIPYYEFTKLQALVCEFNTTVDNSVATEKVSINRKVYDSNSTVEIATVTSNSEDMAIDLGINNNSTKPCLVRFFTYKEVP